MRISTNQYFDVSIRAINDQQSALVKVSQQISAERALLTPADDPVAASREVALDASRRISDQMVKNQEDVKGQLEQTENYFFEANNALQAFRSKLVQAGGGALSAENRQSLLAEMTSLRDQLMGIANTQDENGNYVFAGFRRDTQPFVRTADGVVYQGDGGVRQSQIGINRVIDANFSGAYLFDDVPTGQGGLVVGAGADNMGSAVLSGASVVDQDAWNAAAALGPYEIRFGADGNYSVEDSTGAAVASGVLGDGQSVEVAGVSISFNGSPADGDTMTIGAAGSQSLFDTLDQAIASLKLPDSSQESVRRANLLYGASINIDAGMSRVLEAHSALGARLGDVDAAITSDTARGDAIETEIARVVGADSESLTALAGELAKRTYTVQAAQLTYTRISQLSIFNYL